MPWEGECNRCGLCCTRIVDGAPTRCQHLRIVSADEAICEKYVDGRWPGMPVALLDAENRVVKWDVCIPAFPLHHTARIPLPAKCGYRWVMDNP